jgi:hypothetical protein
MKSHLHSLHLKDTPGPLDGDQYFTFSENINIFYGLNGSGKTNLIRTIVACLENLELKGEFEDYSLFADLFFPIVEQEVGDDRWERDRGSDHDTFSHIYKKGGPQSLGEIKFDLCDSVIGYPATDGFGDVYVFPTLPEEFQVDSYLDKDTIDFWLQGRPLIHFSPFDTKGSKRYQIHITHVKELMNEQLKNKWYDLINRFVEADKKADELFPSDDDDYMDKQLEFIEKEVTQKVVKEKNVFLNNSNFLWKRVSSAPFPEKNRFVHLPTLGYVKKLRMRTVFESSLFTTKDQNNSTEDIDEYTIRKIVYLPRDINKNMELLEKKSVELSHEVNLIYSKLMFGSPELAFLPTEHVLAVTGNSYSWYFKVANGAGYLPIDKLSLAQKRWAILSIKIAFLHFGGGTKSYSDFPTHALVIDEPESALHITAQQYLVGGLRWLTEERNIQLFIATHSPIFMNYQNGKLFEIRKEIFGSKVYELNNNLRESMYELGLEPVDLLRQISTFLIVEGQHELDIFQELFNEELINKKVHLLPLRGATNLSSIVNSSFIFDFSNAKISIILDNLEIDEVQKIWKEAIQMTDRNELDEAKKFILRKLPAGDRIENKFLREFMNRVLEENLTERIELFGMSKKDIIEYLPSDYFITGSNWGSLTQEFKGQKEEKDFKKWLGKKYKADFSSENIRKAVQEMDSIHPDLTNLINNL